jgi:hypothetical protein
MPTDIELRFDAALTVAETLSPQSQMRALRTFRETSSRFEDARTAFVAAIEEELTAKVATIEVELTAKVEGEREIERRADHRSLRWRKLNWCAVAFLALAAGCVGGWLYTIVRLMS